MPHTDLALLPTRRHEAFRYADLGALGKLWPVEAETIRVGPGAGDALSIVATGGDAVARELTLVLEPRSRFDLRVLNAGSAYGRIEVTVELGEGADFTLGVAQLGGEGQTLEVVTDVRHIARGASSRQTVRSVLARQAVGTYLGRVAVARGCDGTDATQSVRAMLLDRTATANARPELEIFADDVKCAHGCAVGELDAAGLFYLESRGLTPEGAKRLMLQAFIAEAFAGAPEEERLQALALERLEALV